MARNLLLLVLFLAGTTIAACTDWIGDGRTYVFRSATAWKGKTPVKADRILEWKIRVPDDVVVRTDGYYKTAYEHGKTKSWIPWRRFPDGGSLLFMYSQSRPIDAPNQLGAGQSIPAGIEALTISNGKGLSEKYGWDYCVTADERFAGTRGGCHRELPGMVSCSVYMSYNGWPVDVGARIDGLYQQPAKTCQIVKSLLDAWTVSIDHRRNTSE